MTFLDQILKDAADELSATKSRRPITEIRGMIADAPPVRPLPESLEAAFCLIAEIKQRSPSVGPMREENVADALAAYEESPIVRGISILTNQLHFGGSIEYLAACRATATKPLLRKDFIMEEYQVRRPGPSARMRSSSWPMCSMPRGSRVFTTWRANSACRRSLRCIPRRR